MREKTDDYPQVFFVGKKDSLDFQEFLVIYNGRIVKCDSALEALDLAFKSFYIFNIEFPKNCYGAWQFLDYVVYRMKSVCPILATVKMLAAFVGPEDTAQK
jgi:hypothetical protein